MIYHNDQPANDFATLFDTLHSNDSYQNLFSNIYVSVISRSFYERILPTNSTHLIVCFISLHWLSTVPVPLPGKMICHVQPNLPSLAESHPEVFKAWKDQSRDDLETFLRHRSDELKDRGAMVLTLCTYPMGPYGLATILSNAFVEAHSQGLLSEAEADNALMPVYFRTLDEVREGIASVDTLELQHIEEMSCQYAFDSAESLTSFLLSVFKPSLMRCLDPSLDTNEAQFILRSKRLDAFLTLYVTNVIRIARPTSQASITYSKVLLSRRPRPTVPDVTVAVDAATPTSTKRGGEQGNLPNSCVLITINAALLTLAMYLARRRS